MCSIGYYFCVIGVILVLLIILWFFGYIHIAAFPIPNWYLFSINGHSVGLWDLLIFLVVVWAIGVLPSPFRQIASVLLIFWILSTLGILFFGGLSSLLIIAIIVGIVLSLF